MLFSSVSGIRISGISAAVPTQWIPTDKYANLLGKDVVDSFKKSSGVEGRCLAREGQTTADLCYVAAERIIHEKSISREDIGVLVLVTQTPDYGDPSTACVLQHRLNLSRDCLAFDINLGCSGYSYGLNVIASMLRNSDAKYGLLLCGDTISGEPINIDEGASNSATLLLGDAGTATLLERTGSAERIVFAGETQGEGFRFVRNLYGGYRHNVVRGPQYMDDIEVFNFCASNVPRVVREVWEYTNTSENDYDCFGFHQASLFTLKQIAKRLKIDMSKIPLSLAQYGNASSASIPLSLVCAFGDDKTSRELRTLCCGFGVGLSISAAVMLLNTLDIYPLEKTDNCFDDEITEGN